MLELGGAQRNTLYTVANLNPGEFSAILICGKGGMLDEEALSIPRVKTFFVPQLVRQISPLRDVPALYAIFKLLRAEKPDIVHTHSSKAGILGRIAAKLAGVPVIIHTYHGFGFNDFQNAVTKNIFVFAERFAAHLASHFIAVTNEDVAKGVKHGIGPEDKYSIIRSGIDISSYSSADTDKDALKKELNIAPDEKVITTIGPFKPQKNLGDFIKVCALVSKEARNARFLIVGDGEQRPLLEELIKKNDLSSKVSLLGWRKDISSILAITDVFAMTSLWEGLPRSILEAMCSGVPAVANAVDGVKEIIQDGRNGFLVEPGDLNKFASKIIYLLAGAGRAAEMGKNGKITVGRQYDINFMVKQQEKLYKKLSVTHGNGE